MKSRPKNKFSMDLTIDQYGLKQNGKQNHWFIGSTNRINLQNI